MSMCIAVIFFFQAEDGIRDVHVTGVQTCALPICDELIKKFSEIKKGIPQAIDKLTREALANKTMTADMSLDEFLDRSEERRVGKECRSRWRPNNETQKRTDIDETERCESGGDDER